MFFDELGAERAAPLTHVSADMADWIASSRRALEPLNAVRCADPFHVVAWAIDALDVERRRAWNEASGRRRRQWELDDQRRSDRRRATISTVSLRAVEEPGATSPCRQRHQLDWIAKTDPRLWRAYLLKEGLRYVFTVKGDDGKAALDRWILWARRSRLPAFVELQRRIITHRAAIDATLDAGMSNALVEAANTKIRLLTRIAFGFHGPEPLIALAMLSLGGHTPPLPGRT